LQDTVLAAYLRDNVQARILNAEGVYQRPEISAGEKPFNSQTYFEGDNSFPAPKKNHSSRRKRLWAKKLS
jgi:polyphosphate kinase